MYCGEDFLSANTLSRLSTCLLPLHCRASPLPSSLARLNEKAVVAKTTLFLLTLNRQNTIITRYSTATDKIDKTNRTDMNDDATVSNVTEGAETFKHFMIWKIHVISVCK